MKTFKTYFTESEVGSKGAFKRFPIEQQPERIPLEKFYAIIAQVKDKFRPLGKMYFPDATKKAYGKDTTGDIDVIFVPDNRETWTQDILKDPDVIAHTKNGPQLMTVMKFGDNQYMIDFLLTKPESFDYRKMYHGFGTIIPAVVGSFARSMGYKFGYDGLYARVKDAKGNYHNIEITRDPKTALQILMLDPSKLETRELYTPEGVANWILNSPRFDSGLWNRPHQTDGQTIVTKNRKSHSAAKKKDEVVDTYKIIDNATKMATWDNTNYRIEREILGDNFVKNMKKQAEAARTKSVSGPITGNEIMQILNIPPGPKIGEIIKYITQQNFTREQALHYLHQLTT